MSLDDFKASILCIKARIDSQSAGHNHQSVSKTVDTQLSFAAYASLCPILKMLTACHFERTSSWNYTLVLNCVDHSAQAITNCFLDLSNSVVIRSLDKNSAREWVVNTFNKSVLIVTKSLLVDVAGPT